LRYPGQVVGASSVAGSPVLSFPGALLGAGLSDAPVTVKTGHVRVASRAPSRLVAAHAAPPVWVTNSARAAASASSLGALAFRRTSADFRDSRNMSTRI